MTPTRSILRAWIDFIKEEMAGQVGAVIRFDGDPAEAIEKGLARRSDGFVIFVGFTAEEIPWRDMAGQPLSVTYPVSLLIVTGQGGRSGLEEEAEAMDDVMDALQERLSLTRPDGTLRRHIVDFGIMHYQAETITPIAGASWHGRRLTYQLTASRP